MSKLVKFSIGYVSKDKPEDSPYVRVIPVETSVQIDGIIEDEDTTILFDGIDEDGEAISGKVNSSIAIVAEWIGSDSNRMTAPDLRKGEVVTIYKYADEDRYFWESRNTKSKLRDTEHVVHLFSAKPKGDRAYLDLSNSYSITISSRDQQITVMLTDYNGEKASFVLQLDGKNGKAMLMDNKGQQFAIESLINRITLINKQKSSVVLDKEDILVSNMGNLIDKTAKMVSIECKEYKVVCNSWDVLAKESFVVESPAVSMKSDAVTVDAPTSTFTGMVQTGPLTCASLSVAPPAGRAAQAAVLRAGAKSGGAICKILGDVDVEGDFIFKNGNLDMGGGNITNIGSASGGSAAWSDSCTAPNIK